jgi:uncharacterized protein YjbI with pentapeptide repeats
MANEEQLKLLRKGTAVWNEWRKENRDLSPDLSEADLGLLSLAGADLSRANLSGSDLGASSLCEANLTGALLDAANLSGAILTGVGIFGPSHRLGQYYPATDLSGINLSGGISARWTSASWISVV